MKLNVSHFTPQILLLFIEMENLEFSDSKMWSRGESENVSKYWRLCKFEKGLNCPRLTEQVPSL